MRTSSPPSSSFKTLFSSTLHTILLEVGGLVYIPHTLDSLEKLGLNPAWYLSLASSFMSALSNMHTNLLAHNALLRRASTTHDKIARKVALLGTCMTLDLPLLHW